MSHTILPISYATVEDLLQTRTDLGSITALSSMQMALELGKTEALINAKLSPSYVVPVSPAPPLLTALSTDLTVYNLLIALSMFKVERLKDHPWYDRYQASLKLLDQIATGAVPLATSSGAVIGTRTDQRQLTSTTEGFRQTFYEGEWPDMVPDPDKIEQEFDARD